MLNGQLTLWNDWILKETSVIFPPVFIEVTMVRPCWKKFFFGILIGTAIAFSWTSARATLTNCLQSIVQKTSSESSEAIPASLFAKTAAETPSTVASQTTSFAARRAKILSEIKQPKIRAYIKDNMFQEAIWALRLEKKSSLATQVEEFLEHSIKNAKFIDSKRAEEGLTETYFVTLDNGIQGYWKPHPDNWKLVKASQTGDLSSINAEVDAYVFDRQLELDIVPMTLELRNNGVPGSFQIKVEHGESNVFSDDPSVVDMRLFDYLIHNQDRGQFSNHFSFNDRVVAIDHGASFLKKYAQVGRFRPFGPMGPFNNAIGPSQMPFYRNLKFRLTEKQIRTLLNQRHSPAVIKEIVFRRTMLLKNFEQSLGKISK